MDRSWKTKLLRRLAPMVASVALAGCSGRSDGPAATEVTRATPRDAWAICDIGIDYVQPTLDVMPVDAESPVAHPQAVFEPRLRRLPALTDGEGTLALLPTVSKPAVRCEIPQPVAAPAPPKIEPLRVPTIDLSDALAAIVRRPATPTPVAENEQVASPPPSAVAAEHPPVTTPSATPRSRWSDPLSAASVIIEQQIVEPRPSASRAPSRLASHAPRDAAAPLVVARLPVAPDEPAAQSMVAAPQAATATVLQSPQFDKPAAPAAPPLPQIDELALPAPQDMAMRAVQVRAEAQIRHAFGLARRGAHYSAKAELVEVLRTTTQALDMRDGATDHSDALARAFRALDEAGDFQPRGAGLESNLDLAMLVAGHQTPVLKNEDVAKVTALAALQRYYTYAQQQFTAAGDGQPTASAALFGLGRLQSIISGPRVGGLSDGAPQAMVFHQAAVMVDGANYKSANELGVLLARYGQYDSARELLVYSVRVSPQVQSWQNLATVHEQLGEMDLARQAMHEARLTASGHSAAVDADSPVRWVPPATLARSAPQTGDALISPASNRTASPAEQPTHEVRGIMKFLPWTRED